MSVRIYSEGNYFFLEDPDASTPLSDHRSEVKIWFNNDNKYQIESKLIGSHKYVLADLVDINSVAYSQSGWDTFYRANTGFNTVSGGSGTAKGWKEAVEYYANLPLTLITPIIGDIYLVEKPTKIGMGLLSYTTRQSGLWIKDANTGSLSDWRKLGVKVKFLDNEFAVVSVADETKQMKLDSSEISTSTVRTLKFQDIDGTIALLSDFGTVSLTADPFPIFDTAVALTDLNSIITDLEALPVTGSHANAFLNETLTPGSYTTAGAATINGTLTLNGGGVANAIFVIRSGAAMSLGASATIVLSGGTLPENVHFLSNGAFPLGTNCVMNGNMICKTGAPSAAAGCTIVGRMLTTNGAVSASTTTLSKPTGIGFNIDYRTCIDLIMFTGVTTVTNTGASVYTGDIATNSGTITGFGAATVNGSIYSVGVSIVNQNNYLPVQTSGGVTFPNTDIVYISPTAPVKITGFDSTGFVENQKFTIFNLGMGDLTLETLSPDSSNNNKIAANTDILIKQYQGKSVVWVNGTFNKWLIKGNN